MLRGQERQRGRLCSGDLSLDWNFDFTIQWQTDLDYVTCQMEQSGTEGGRAHSPGLQRSVDKLTCQRLGSEYQDISQATAHQE